MHNNDVYFDRYTVDVTRDKKTLKKVSENWTFNGQAGRVDEPASRTWDKDTGHLTHEVYLLLDEVHRKSSAGPARSEWHPETGRLIREEYIEDGYRHRENSKPAFIEYDPHNGMILKEEYWINGKKVAPPAKNKPKIEDTLDKN